MRTAALAIVVAVLVAACSPSSDNKNTSGDSGDTGGTSAAEKAAAELGIDLSKCPVDITKPLSGTIKIGSPLALTGPVAVALAPLAVGQKAAVQYFNETADLPVKLDLVLKDDQFAPDKTLAAVQELTQSDKVDLIDGIVGTANVVAAGQAAQQYCVPVIAANASGRPANQPKQFPFTSVWSLPSYVDANAWVERLKEQFPSGAKVAVFTANTETGKAYVDAIASLTQGTNLKVVSKTTIEATDAAAPASQVTTMKASGANVLLAAPSPSGQCSALVKEVANEGWKPGAFMITSQCSTLQLMQPAGQAAQGVLCDLYINDPAASSASSDEGLQKIVSAIRKYQAGQPNVGSTISGFSEVEVLAKAIEQAAASPLGASRLGILYAATHMTYQSATMLPGVTYSLNYPEDGVAMESAQLSSFDAASGQWKKVQVYDFNGKTSGKASD